jgi:nucleotide-binding universal stress UspA family protein
MAKRILVPLNADVAHDDVLPIVRAVARDSGGSVRLLRVYPVPQQVIAPSGRPLTYLDQEMDRLTALGTDELRRLAAELPGVPVETVVRFGEPVEEILLEAEAAGADLIALSESARGRWRDAVAPGVATRVARKSSIPTLVLRR